MGALRPDGMASAELKRMRVHTDWQRQGRGRAMLGVLEQRARELGFRALVLDTTEDLVAARSLYESAGYVELAALSSTGTRSFSCGSSFSSPQLLTCGDRIERVPMRARRKRLHLPSGPTHTPDLLSASGVHPARHGCTFLLGPIRPRASQRMTVRG